MKALIRPGSADKDRYDRSRRIGWIDLSRVANAEVLMVGAGALGNEVAKDLVLSGFRSITVVDMDHVVGSNLSRCLFFSEEDARKQRKKADVVKEGIKRLSEEALPVSHVGRIEDMPKHVFNRHDIVLGCLDNIAARIHVNSHAYVAGKSYVDGGMEGMLGKIMISKPPDGACIQCGMNKTHAKIAGLRFSCTGRDVVFHEPRLAAEITTTSVISAIMVREALKIVSGHPELVLNNSLYYDGRKNIMEELEIPLDPSCPVHGSSDAATGKRKRFKSI